MTVLTEVQSTRPLRPESPAFGLARASAVIGRKTRNARQARLRAGSLFPGPGSDQTTCCAGGRAGRIQRWRDADHRPSITSNTSATTTPSGFDPVSA